VLAAFGRRLLLTHGDALCLSDTDYQRFRAEVRSGAWREDFLARPLGEREAVARHLRDASEQRKREAAQGHWHDVDVPAALHWLRAAGAEALIHGHTHRPQSAPLGPGPMRHVLSDWDLDDAPPPGRAEVLRLSARGLERLPAALAGRVAA
jgi:UDP-2,3-diacylglucosamine hydrolase